MGGSSAARLAIDARYINDRYHGIGRYAFRLLEALVAEVQARGLDYHFDVYRGRLADTRFDWQALLTNPHVTLREGPKSLYWPQEQVAWRRILRLQPVDLFYSPYFVAPLLAPARLSVAVTVHDLIFERYPQYMPLGWTRPYYRLLVQLSLRRAQGVAAVSQATANDLRSYYPGLGGRVVVTSEGAEPAYQLAAARLHLAEALQRFQLERPYILTVGARRPHKNLPALVQAFARLAPRLPHTLVFAGPPDRRFPDEARRLSVLLGLGSGEQACSRVRFLDWVPEEDLPGLYAGADLVCLPSLIEGFGLPALEAMACGAPVLAAAGSAFPEVIGGAGRLVCPEDPLNFSKAMEEILGDETTRQEMSRAGLQRARQFTWQRSAARVLDLFQHLLAKAGS